MNEIIFFVYCIFLALASCTALLMGKEALITLVSLQAILANLFVTKSIYLFGFTATAADALAVGSMLCLNLLQEYYGKKSAQQALWISLASGVIYMIITQLHLAYEPSLIDTCQSHFKALLQHTPRLIAASYITYGIVQAVEITLYGYLRRMFDNKLFFLRNSISMTITQLIDTILFTALGLFGIMSNLYEIILVSYSIKLFAMFSMIPTVSLIKKIVK